MWPSGRPSRATLPATYLGLPLASYRISPLGNGNWDVVARYDSREPKDSSYTFDTGGGTQHITQSLETIAKKAKPGETAPDFKQAVGVTTDSVEGVDITVPSTTSRKPITSPTLWSQAPTS